MPEVQPVYIYHTLGCGLRCVYTHEPGLAEVCGVAVDAGSRDESAPCQGLAHFVEHTVFKGTQRRKAWHILNRMESVGGELNAYTTKETTTVYSLFPAGNARRAIELIADLVCSATFPQNELDCEREVVEDELRSYLDTPSEAVFDDIDELMFRGSSLAHNILGTEHTIRSFDSQMCRRWMERFYGAERMVFFYSGPTDERTVFAAAEKWFAPLAARKAEKVDRTAPSAVEVRRVERDQGHHQSHTVMGARTISMFHPDRFALGLVTNILGGPGMNSLLNLELRERRGLVYTVEAGCNLYTDCGAFTVYFGCDHSDTTRCMRLAEGVLRRFADNGLTQRRLDLARRQYLGQLAVASENRENMALGMGRAFLYHGRVATQEELRERIEAVDRPTVERVAQMLRPEVLNVLTLA